VWQKLFSFNHEFYYFYKTGYPLQNSSLRQLHNDGGIVSIVHSSAGRLLLEYQNGAPSSGFMSWRNKKKSQGLRTGE
jgi:hypothetical protein